MNRSYSTGLWLNTLLIFWGWSLGCGPAGEPGSGVVSPAKTAVLPEAEAVQPVEIVRANDYSEGVVINHEGNLYVAHYGMRQVQVLDPEGKLIRRYPGGNLTTSNCAFGGPKLDQLFVTGGTPGALFRLDLGVPGLDIRPKRREKPSEG